MFLLWSKRLYPLMLIGIVFSGMGVSGPLRILDVHINKAVSLPFQPSRVDDVVVVEQVGTSQEFGDDALAGLVSLLTQADAAQIVLTYDPAGDQDLPRDFFGNPSDHVYALRQKSTSGEAAADSSTGLVGATAWLPDASFGFYRYARSTTPDGDPTLESVVDLGAPPPDRFEVNYATAANGLPLFSANQVLQAGALDRFFAGKIVVIGAPEVPLQAGPGLRLFPDTAAVNALTYHANALATLRMGQPAVPVSPMSAVILIWFATLAALGVASGSGTRGAKIRHVIILLLGLMATGLLHARGGVALPVAAMAAAYVSGAITIWIAREVRQDTRLQRLLRRALLPVSSSPRTQAENVEQWERQAVNAAEILGLSQSVFLMREADGKWKQRAAMRADLTDFKPLELSEIETRRPKSGVPSLTALEATGKTWIDSGIEAWTIPLISADGIHGQWILATPRGHIAAQPKLRDAIEAVAAQLTRDRPQTARAYGFSIENAFRKQIDTQLVSIVDRLLLKSRRLRLLVESTYNAFAVFDLEGNALSMNGQMRKITAGIGDNPNLLDMVSHLCTLRRAEVVELTAALVRGQKALMLAVAEPFGDRHYMMKLSYSDRPDQAGGRDSEHAFLCEMIDVTERNARKLVMP